MSNFYLALGIDKDADLDKIKKVYRLFSRKYQPDLADREQKEGFLKIQDAYERGAYDRSLAESPHAVPVEFLKRAFWDEKEFQGHRIRLYSSAIDDFFEGFISGFFEDDFSGNKDLFLELILSPQEARTGGDFPVEIPILEDCASCAGRGYTGHYICQVCGGSGNMHHNRSFDLHVPSGVSTGSEAKVSLDGIGLENVCLNVEVVVR
jgi:molecular chaperone DnaJ